MSALEDLLAFHLRAARLPTPVREYRFHDTRAWRFDFAWPAALVAVEVDGGTWNGGRHSRGAGYANDCEKRNAAVLAGWRVLSVTSEMVHNGQAAALVQQALERQEEAWPS
jgi:very-short-patch-repair endonuclease